MISEDAKDELLAAEIGRWSVVYLTYGEYSGADYFAFETDADDMESLRRVEGAYLKHINGTTVPRDFYPADGRFKPDIQRFFDDCHQQCIDVRLETAP